MSARSLDINGKMNQGNIKVIKYPDMNILDVKLHDNLIVSRTGNQVTLSSCGWKTPTTKVAINNCLGQMNCPVYIEQRKGNWYLMTENGKLDFVDGMTIKAGE